MIKPSYHPPFVLQKKAEPAQSFTFGSSAILVFKIRRFPPPPHDGFGFVGSRQFTGQEKCLIIL